MKHPVKTAMVALRGPRTEGPMAPEIDLSKQRPAEYVFSRHVEDAMKKAHAKPAAMVDAAE